MRLAIFFTLLLSFCAAAVYAQEAGKAQRPAAPVLADEDGKPIDGVRAARVQVRAVVHGTLTQATMTLTFANDQARILGGNLTFPLPEGAAVTGYGLDINGQMVDGVAVEKGRARVIYESELHKRVDPGLVEQVAGNAFRTRLYPIPPHGTRSIKIEYVTPIEQGKDGAVLALPLGFADVLDHLEIRIEVPEATAAPEVKSGGIAGLAFDRGDRGFVASASAEKVKAADELVVALANLPAQSVAVEKRLKLPRTIEELQAAGNPAQAGSAYEHYFVATDSPAVAPRLAAPLKNGRVGVVWDASLSRNDVDHEHELKLLQAVLSKLGNPSADLIVLRNDIQVQPLFGPGASGTAKLIETIKALSYDGATNLGGMILPRNACDLNAVRRNCVADYDLFILFSDGVGNLGPDMPLRAEAPVYAMSDDVHANHALLRALCQESGGGYLNLKRVSDEQAIAGVGDAPLSLVSVECDPHDIADVYPPAGTAVPGRIAVSGRLLVPEAKLTLHYGYGRQIVASQSFTLSTAGAAEGSLLPRFWAQQKAAALSLFPEQNAAQLAELGKRFNLVTATTSLLVLETADQYVQYRVVPPLSRPEIYQAFVARIDQEKALAQKTHEQKLQQVAALWNARVQWWEAPHSYPTHLAVNPEGLTPAQVANASTPTAGSPVAGRRAPGDDPASSAGQGGDRPRSAIHPSPTANGRSGEAAMRDREVRQNMAADSAAPNTPTAATVVPPPAPVALGTNRGVASERGERHADDQRDAAGLPGLDPRPGGRLRERLKAAKDEDGKEVQDQINAFADTSIEIVIKPWDPNTPYIQAMKAVPAEGAYTTYLEQRKSYAHSPAFYLDCADYLVSIEKRELAVRVLTDIVELQLQDARLLRVAAHRLNQIGQRDLAIDLFEKVLRLRPEEPQSYRDLALALADRADAGTTGASSNAAPSQEHVDRAVADYARSLELLNKVVLGDWPRFPEVELPVLMEANAIAARAQRLPGVHDFHNPIDIRLQKTLDLDVRVAMTWDADQTDIDLWVTEPSGEKCFYGHNRTIIGGLLSHDFTDGYGPEEYCLRKLMPGKYLIQANFFGSRQQELTGPATVQATVITNFGRPNEKRQALTIRLKDVKQVIDLGTITLGGAGEATR